MNGGPNRSRRFARTSLLAVGALVAVLVLLTSVMVGSRFTSSWEAVWASDKGLVLIGPQNQICETLTDPNGELTFSGTAHWPVTSSIPEVLRRFDPDPDPLLEITALSNPAVFMTDGGLGSIRLEIRRDGTATALIGDLSAPGQQLAVSVPVHLSAEPMSFSLTVRASGEVTLVANGNHAAAIAREPFFTCSEVAIGGQPQTFAPVRLVAVGTAPNRISQAGIGLAGAIFAVLVALLIAGSPLRPRRETE